MGIAADRLHGSIHGLKALHPNLAARPYRDYRPVWALVLLLGAVTAALLIYNIQTAYRYFGTTEQTRVGIAGLEEQIATERSRAQAARQEAERFDTQRLRARSEFVNARIAERAFSWSELLDDLEDVFPNDVRVIRLVPQQDPTGGFTIRMEGLAKKQGGMVTLIQNMLRSPKFERPFPDSEAVQEDGQVRFSLTAEYRPSLRGVAR